MSTSNGSSTYVTALHPIALVVQPYHPSSNGTTPHLNTLLTPLLPGAHIFRILPSHPSIIGRVIRLVVKRSSAAVPGGVESIDLVVRAVSPRLVLLTSPQIPQDVANAQISRLCMVIVAGLQLQQRLPGTTTMRLDVIHPDGRWGTSLADWIHLQASSNTAATQSAELPHPEAQTCATNMNAIVPLNESFLCETAPFSTQEHAALRKTLPHLPETVTKGPVRVAMRLKHPPKLDGFPVALLINVVARTQCYWLSNALQSHGESFRANFNFLCKHLHIVAVRVDTEPSGQGVLYGEWVLLRPARRT
ncbi:hypothetical protein C8Q77DRAFT_718540 [Trametes polyzona]|nr:hypothetical protein C8Q77DRAFT_718540 [Trametes polyzona]